MCHFRCRLSSIEGMFDEIYCDAALPDNRLIGMTKGGIRRCTNIVRASR